MAATGDGWRIIADAPPPGAPAAASGIPAAAPSTGVHTNLLPNTWVQVSLMSYCESGQKKVPCTIVLAAYQSSLSYPTLHQHFCSPRSYADRLARATDSPRSVSPSAHGSEERPRSRTTSHHSIRPQSQPSHTGKHTYKFGIPWQDTVCPT